MQCASFTASVLHQPTFDHLAVPKAACIDCITALCVFGLQSWELIWVRAALGTFWGGDGESHRAFLLLFLYQVIEEENKKSLFLMYLST